MPLTAAEPLCVAEGLSRRYGRLVALEDCSLSLMPSEVVGLAGPNGAGKTTLARLLLGFLEPTSGQVKIGGLTPAELRRTRGVGYLPEELPVPWDCTVQELLQIRAVDSGAPLGVDRVVELLGLKALLHRSIARLSKGQYRLAMIAYAALGPSSLVVLDEPDSGLDPAALDRLLDTIKAVASSGSAVLALSHNLDELQRACDRLVFISSGRILGTRHRAELEALGARECYRQLVQTA